jgi:hypothetical protein
MLTQRRKGAKAQRNAEHSIAEEPCTRAAKSKMAISWFLAIPHQPLAKTFVTPSKGTGGYTKT